MDHEMSDYYEREFRAAHALGVCPECHFEGGLHNEGACSQWRAPAEPECLHCGDGEPLVLTASGWLCEDCAGQAHDPTTVPQGYHLIDGKFHRCAIWDGAEACGHCERLDTPPDLSYHATFERAIRVEDY